MKKLSISIICLVATSQLLFSKVLPESKDPAIQKQADKQIQMQNKAVIKAAVEAFGKNLPQKIDKYTTFIDVKAQDLNLIRIYEINTGAKSDDAVRKEDRSRMEQGITYGVCTTSKRFLDSNITLTYQYISEKSKNELFKFVITPKTCVDIWAGLK